jgi:hypothetical protein
MNTYAINQPCWVIDYHFHASSRHFSVSFLSLQATISRDIIIITFHLSPSFAYASRTTAITAPSFLFFQRSRSLFFISWLHAITILHAFADTNQLLPPLPHHHFLSITCNHWLHLI